MSEQPTVWSWFKDKIGGTAIKTIAEIHALMPDSILFGSILMYFLTQNMAFGIFAAFIFETVLSHKLISWISSQTVGSRPVEVQCRQGFKTPQFKPERILSNNAYPSYGVYSITSIATYLGLATKEFSETLNAMGPEWSSRGQVAYIFIGIVLSAFYLAKWFSGCDSISDIFVAAIIGIVIGIIFYVVNKAIFGTESMNFLGLPYLVSKENEGSPIYVCAAETNDSITA